MTFRIPLLPPKTRLFRLACTVLAIPLAAITTQCTSESGTDAPPAQGDVITMLSPQDGATFKMTDTIKIISRSDYTRFGSNLTFSFSDDSGKTWILILSKPRVKSGANELDTVPWVPLDGGIVPGKIKFRVQEYDKVYRDIGDFVNITAAAQAPQAL